MVGAKRYRLRSETRCCYCGTRLAPGSTAYGSSGSRAATCSRCVAVGVTGSNSGVRYRLRGTPIRSNRVALSDTPPPGFGTPDYDPSFRGVLERVIREDAARSDDRNAVFGLAAPAECLVVPPLTRFARHPIVVAPSGVWVLGHLDTATEPEVVARRWPRRPRASLIADGVDRTDLLESVARVASLIGPCLDHAPVHLAVGLESIAGPQLGPAIEINGVLVVRMRSLLRRIGDPGPLTTGRIESIHRTLTDGPSVFFAAR